MCLSDGELQAFVDAELPPAAREGVTRHFESCARCRDRAHALDERGRFVMGLLGRSSSGEEAASPARALASFRTRVEEQPRWPVFAPALMARLAVGALGVVVITVAAGVLARFGEPHSIAVPLPSRPVPVATAVAPGRPAVGGLMKSSPLAVRAAARGPAALSRPEGTRSGGPFDDYLALTDAGPQQMGMIIRVKLPFSALGGASDASIRGQGTPDLEADVLVGQDGRALAIRVVSDTNERK